MEWSDCHTRLLIAATKSSSAVFFLAFPRDLQVICQAAAITIAAMAQSSEDVSVDQHPTDVVVNLSAVDVSHGHLLSLCGLNDHGRLAGAVAYDEELAHLACVSGGCTAQTDMLWEAPTCTQCDRTKRRRRATLRALLAASVADPSRGWPLRTDLFRLGAVQEHGHRESQDDRFVIVENEISIAATAPKIDLQQNGRVLVVGDEDGWLMAVADDVSGTRHPGIAATAAIESLPALIRSREEMLDAFESAHSAVCAASDAREDYEEANLANVEITTLAVASLTQQGGLQVGWVGDTLPFLIPCDGGAPGWHGRPSHERLPDISLDYAKSGRIRSKISYWLGGYRPEVDLVDRPFRDLVRCMSDTMQPEAFDTMAAEHGLLVLLASDGFWDPLLESKYGDDQYADFDLDQDDNSLGFAVPTWQRNNPQIALDHMMSTANQVGLDDNATATAAVICP